MKTNHKLSTLVLKGMKALVGLAIATSVLFAQKIEDYKPRIEQNQSAPALKISSELQKDPVSEQVILQALKGMVFVATPNQVIPYAMSGTGIVVHDLPELEQADIQATLTNSIGQPVTMASLTKIQQAVILHFRAQQLPVVDVIIPEQDISKGVVQFVVIVGKLGEVKVRGNEYFDSDLLMSYVTLKKGDYIYEDDLVANSRWLNDNPFRQVGMSLEKGSTPGSADLVLDVRDRRPYRIYGGYENSGNYLTGKDRYLAGFNWGNVFNRDGVFGYQYTQSKDSDVLSAHSASYTMVNRFHHKFSIFGSYSETDVVIAGAGAKALSSEGRSYQVSGRYVIPVLTPRLKSYQVDFTTGMDFKNTNSQVEFGGAPITGIPADEVEVVQFMGGLSGKRPDAYGNTQVSLDLFGSPGGITSQNQTTNFRQQVQNSEADYFYGQFNVNRQTNLPGRFTWNKYFQGQFSSDNLLGSERMSLGGYNTVRGYEPGEVSGDFGIRLTNQLELPSFSLLNGKLFKQSDLLTTYFFWDYGTVWAENEKGLGDTSRDLSSVGPGLMYRVGSHLTFRLDYGFQLIDSGQSPTGDNSRVDMGLILSY